MCQSIGDCRPLGVKPSSTAASLQINVRCHLIVSITSSTCCGCHLSTAADAGRGLLERLPRKAAATKVLLMLQTVAPDAANVLASESCRSSCHGFGAKCGNCIENTLCQLICRPPPVGCCISCQPPLQPSPRGFQTAYRMVSGIYEVAAAAVAQHLLPAPLSSLSGAAIGCCAASVPSSAGAATAASSQLPERRRQAVSGHQQPAGGLHCSRVYRPPPHIERDINSRQTHLTIESTATLLWQERPAVGRCSCASAPQSTPAELHGPSPGLLTPWRIMARCDRLHASGSAAAAGIRRTNPVRSPMGFLNCTVQLNRAFGWSAMPLCL